MKATFYTSVDVYSNESFTLIKKFLELEQFKLNIIQDLNHLMILAKGRVNPCAGFVVVINEDVCFDIYDVVKSIEKHGYRKI